MTEKIKITDVDTSAEKKLSFTKTFVVEYTDPDTGKKLVGNFTVERATLGQLANFGIIKARLNGGMKVEGYIDWMNEMIAFCQATLSDTPSWWDPQNSYDQALLVDVYNHVRSFQDSFRGPRVEQQQRAAQEAGSGSVGAGVAPAVVVSEVQPTT